MGNQLTRLNVENFRSLADVSIDIRPVNVLFGPNGSGKSTLLEATRLLRDCISRDVEEAVRIRNNGFGMLRQGVDEWRGIKIGMETALAGYALRLGFSRGQIEPYAGEVLYSPGKFGDPLMFRRIGRDEADFCYCDKISPVLTRLIFPEKLALIQYMQRKEHTPQAVFALRRQLNSIHFYHSHYIDLSQLKHRGSE